MDKVFSQRAKVKLNAAGEATFSSTLLHQDRITDENVVELATSAALDTVSIHRAANASLQIAGNGYQIQLPGAADGGFHVGDRAPCTPAPNLLVIATEGPNE